MLKFIFLHQCASRNLGSMIVMVIIFCTNISLQKHHSVQLWKNAYYGHVRIRLNNYVRFYQMIISNSCLIKWPIKILMQERSLEYFFDSSNFTGDLCKNFLYDDVRNSYIIILFSYMMMYWYSNNYSTLSVSLTKYHATQSYRIMS